MSADFGASRLRRTTSLALVYVVVWLVASASASVLGVWLALDGASVGLGVATCVLDRSALQLLRPSARLVLVGVVAGCSMVAATYLLYPLCARAWPLIRPIL